MQRLVDSLRWFGREEGGWAWSGEVGTIFMSLIAAKQGVKTCTGISHGHFHCIFRAEFKDLSDGVLRLNREKEEGV